MRPSLPVSSSFVRYQLIPTDIPLSENVFKITLPNRQLDGGAINGEAIELFNNDKSIIYENNEDIPIKLCDNNIDNFKCSEE